MRSIVAALAALAALLLSQAAAAEERILSFDSQVAIRKDGSLDVTETIRVRVENVVINHGIFRDFPTRYKAPGGRRVRVGFDLAGTWLDGQEEPNKVETLMNGVRIRIGSADKIVPFGEHEYRIRYHATRMLGRFEGYDELYWNVTGNGWDFPIDRASATITLPLCRAVRPALGLHRRSGLDRASRPRHRTRPPARLASQPLARSIPARG
jgi:hypothetical protein